MKQRIKTLLTQTYSLVPESLALYRIGMAAVLLGIIITILPYSDMLLGRHGALPIENLLERKIFVLHGLFDHPLYMITLYGIQILAALCLLVGYRTRTATIISWVLLLSMQTRNPMILHSGDVLLKLMLFWGMFLPLGNYYSVDAHQRTSKPETNPVLTAAGIGLLLQIALLYGASAYTKKDPVWHSTGEALYYVLNVDYLALPAGKWLLALPADFLKMLSLGVYYMEAFAPLVLLNPFYAGPLRTGIIGLLILMHLAFIPTLNIGFFPWIDIVALLALLPLWFWKQNTPPTRFLKSFLLKADNMLKQLATRLPQFALQLPQKMHVSTRRIANMLGVFFIIFMLAANLRYINVFYRVSGPYLTFIKMIGFEQNWGVFAPAPPRSDGWPVVNGKLTNSNTENNMDLLTGQPPAWEKPENMIAFYKSDRLWKYLINVTSKCSNSPVIHAFGEYLCRQWDKKDKPVEGMDFYFMRESTPDYKTPNIKKPVEKVSLGTYECKE